MRETFVTWHTTSVTSSCLYSVLTVVYLVSAFRFRSS